MVQVREKSRFGPCYALGELIGETATRYFYRNRAGTAFVSKSSSIHLAPCRCARTIESAKRRLKLHRLAGEQERQERAGEGAPARKPGGEGGAQADLRRTGRRLHDAGIAPLKLAQDAQP